MCQLLQSAAISGGGFNAPFGYGDSGLRHAVPFLACRATALPLGAFLAALLTDVDGPYLALFHSIFTLRPLFIQPMIAKMIAVCRAN